jgi:RNA-binding protein YhbY
MKVVLLLLFIPFVLLSQKVEVFTNIDSLKVGFPFKLTYRLKMNATFPWKEKSSKVFPAFSIENPKDSCFVELVKEERVKDSEGWQKYEMTLIPWDTGTVVLKETNYSLGDSTVTFSSDTVFVSTELIDGSNDIIDIREKFIDSNKSSNDNQQKNNWIYWVYLFLGLGIMSALLYWVLIKRKRKSRESLLKTPKERALNELEKLKNARTWETNQKDYYDKLSWILRTYITEEFLVNLMDKTTSETTVLLKTMGLNASIVKEIEEILNSADLVKFAASSSSHIFAQEKLETCVALIDTLKKNDENVG